MRAKRLLAHEPKILMNPVVRKYYTLAEIKTELLRGNCLQRLNPRQKTIGDEHFGVTENLIEDFSIW